MTNHVSRALEEFISQWGDEPGLVVVQVFIGRVDGGYELRHEADRDAEAGSLRLVEVPELRALAQSTAAGTFRPLKSAPNLRRGWRCPVSNDAALQRALDQLYPGALADWLAAGSDPVPVTDFREFTGRQTGMYRATALLTDRQAAEVIGVCCDEQFCLKRRLWTVSGLAVDEAGRKSVVPCLEPCPVLLEFARKAVRLGQEGSVEFPLSAGDLETVESALAIAAVAVAGSEREADFGAAANSRRLRRVSELLKPYLAEAREKRSRGRP